MYRGQHLLDVWMLCIYSLLYYTAGMVTLWEINRHLADSSLGQISKRHLSVELSETKF